MCSERDSPLKRLYRRTHAKLTRLAGSGQLVWAAGCELSLALVHARRPAWPGETSETILRVAPPRKTRPPITHEWIDPWRLRLPGQHRWAQVGATDEPREFRLARSRQDKRLKRAIPLTTHLWVERSKMRSISIHIIANQSSYHDDKSTLQCFICVFCPQLIRNVRSRRRIDSSSIIAHPVNSDAHLGEIVKMLSQELDIYIYIALDNRYGFFYQFNLGFSQFLFMKSLKFFFFNFLKLAGLWLVGEVVAIYGSKVAEGFSAFQRRSC